MSHPELVAYYSRNEGSSIESHCHVLGPKSVADNIDDIIDSFASRELDQALRPAALLVAVSFYCSD